MKTIISIKLINIIILLTIIIINTFVKLVYGHTKVYNSDDNLNYILDDDINKANAPLIKFLPEKLNFNEHSVGIPVIRRVTVENLQEDDNIQMISISGNSVNFHCSFFENKNIMPKGNTTFEVVFLARHEGPVNNTLFIHTSVGSFNYQVTAMGVSNNFRLRPFVGAKVPINSSYSPLIHIYNPYNLTLQLTEMYSSGGGLHLELPNGDEEGPDELWQVPPFQTKAIMRANFLAKSENNHTAFIRIKTNSSEDESLILPIEVEVSSAPGIYSPVDMLDFGVMRTHDQPKTIGIEIINSGTKHIQIQNVICTPVNEALNITFDAPVRLAPDTFHSVSIARVTLNPSNITQCSKQCHGKIVVKSKNNQYKLAIPYKVDLLQGYLSYNNNLTQFYINSDLKQEIRTFDLNNMFNLTMLVYSVNLPEEVKSFFKVELISPSIIISGNSNKKALRITFIPSKHLTHLETEFRINTNISYFDVPLIAYNGKLKVFFPESSNQTILDFGNIGLGEKKSMTFALINNNPINIRLKHWGCNMSKANVELMGIGEGNIYEKNNFTHLSRKNITLLKPKHYAMFKLHIYGLVEEGLFYGQNYVETLFERLTIPFILRTIQGNINAKKLVISNCFPGRICSQVLNISSTFTQQLTFKSAQIFPNDKGFNFQFTNIHINFGNNSVGKVYFDPLKACGKMCYTGIDTSKEVGHLWLSSLSLHRDIGYIDKELYKLHYRMFTMQPNDKSLNASLKLQVDGISSFVVPVVTKLQWPRLVQKNSLKFPISKVGNSTLRELIIENPSSHLLVVQVVLLSDYPDHESIFNLIKSGFHLNWNENEIKNVEIKPRSFFLPNYTSNNNFTDHNDIKKNFGLVPDPNSVTLLISAGSKKRILIGFSPKDDITMSSTILLIRNNLTILDAVYLQGQGGNGILKIGNMLPGPESILSFELIDKHLKSCSKKSQISNSYAIEPTFTVQRTFTAVNVGKLPIRINGFKIGPKNGVSHFCQGYGFKVINCAPFDLRPNENKKINIAFTPDFTLSKVKQYMTIMTDDGQENLQFALVAVLPRNLLSPCNDSLPRPNWEALLYYCLVTIMSFIIILSMCVAFFDGDKTLNYSFYPILTSYSMNISDIEKSNTQESAEKILKSTVDKENVNDIKKSNDIKQRKIKNKSNKISTNNSNNNNNNNNNNSNNSSNNNNNSITVKDDEIKSYYQGQTWTQFLKRKIIRRDSSSSDRSNNSLKNSQQYNSSKNQTQFDFKNDMINDDKNKNKVKKSQKVEVLKDRPVESENKIGKKRLNAPLKNDNLANIVQPSSSSSPSPSPLPNFPSFDKEYKKLKLNKKPNIISKNNTINFNEIEQNNLELPYKPTKSNLNALTKVNKKPKKEVKERNYEYNNNNSSNENSINWDSPITTFNPDLAMNEIVKQTELFAEKTQKPSMKFELETFDELNQFKKSKNLPENNKQKKIMNNPTWSQVRSITPPPTFNFSNDNSSFSFNEKLFNDKTPTFKNLADYSEKSNTQNWFSILNRNNSLDHELSHLRETSSPWNSLPKSTDWNCYHETQSGQGFWDKTISNPNSSQTSWNQTDQWNLPPRQPHNSWDVNDFSKLKTDIALNDNTNEKQLTSNEPSLFNLFGESQIWTPITSNSSFSITQTAATNTLNSLNYFSPQSTQQNKENTNF